MATPPTIVPADAKAHEKFDGVAIACLTEHIIINTGNDANDRFKFPALETGTSDMDFTDLTTGIVPESATCNRLIILALLAELDLHS